MTIRSSDFKKVSVIGLGYVGLPTAATIAMRGITVIGVDVSEHVVNTINNAEIHIVEPGLDIIVRSSVTSGHLRAVLTPQPSDAFVIAVPTPFRDGKKPDVSYIEAAVAAIAPVVKEGNLIVLESTSPVGTTHLVSKRLSEYRPDLKCPHEYGDDADLRVAHCPERILPGDVMREVVENDRVIGGISGACTRRAAEFYRIFCTGNLLMSDSRTAEMAKLSENAYRDVNIAFANELARICEKLDLDVWDLIKFANYHPRVNILQPGAGVGGHCIAVDPWFIVDAAPDEARLIRLSREINDSKPLEVARKIKLKAKKYVRPTIALMGLSYKPDIDDLRESPSLVILRSLMNEDNIEIIGVEPNIDPAGEKGFPVQLSTIDEAIDRADIIVFLVRHSEFSNIKFSELSGKEIIDVAGCLKNRTN
jgi:UDP-N-acetyl-D-mannosaminuronic acid dehydrogenase